MSEEDNSNESSNNEEDEEGEEEEDDEGEEEESDEGEEEEDDEGEEEEDDEGEEEEDDEEDEDDDSKSKKGKKKNKKNKKDKKKEKDKKNKKKGKENSEEIIPKKTTIQLLMEISSEMDTLSSHMEQALPIRQINYISPNINIISNPLVDSHSIMASLDKDDLEIKNLINKANELSNNNNIKKEEEIKTYEDKGCQSEDEIENDGENEDKAYQDYYNNNGNGNKFPYDPNKHLEYYKDLQINNKQVQTSSNNINTLNNVNTNINTNVSHNDTRIKKMEDLYNRTNSIRRQPIIYTQPETSNKNINLNNNYNQLNYINRTNYNNEQNINDKNDNFQRFRPNNISQAMDILLDNE